MYSKILKNTKDDILFFKAALDSLDDCIIITDESGFIDYINDSMKKLSNFSTADCINKKYENVFEIQIDTSTEGLIYFPQTEFAANDIWKNKILVRKDGTRIQVEEKKYDIINDLGKTIGSVITLKNVTKKRAEQLEVMAAKNYYLNFLEKFPALIWRADKNGEFNYFNSRWLDFTGLSIEKQIYDGWIKNIHPEDKKYFIDVFERSRNSQNEFTVEFRLHGNDGEYHWLYCVSNPFNNFKGNYEGWIGVCVDITNRKILEEKLRNEKNISDESNKAKSTFIANMSHEIRTPLNGIIGLTDLLMDTKLDDEQREFLEMVKLSSHSLLSLLNNLLDFSKIEDKKVKLEENKFNLIKDIDEIIKPFIMQARMNGVRFVKEIDKSIPEELVGDGKKIQQILSNLLSNAVKFTQYGTISLLIKIDDVPGINQGKFILHFIVSDTGIGIPEDKQELIFDSFTQIDASITRKYSGSGLGLAIVKELVEIMNGHIWLESEIGKGSNFHFAIEIMNTEKNQIPKINAVKV